MIPTEVFLLILHARAVFSQNTSHSPSDSATPTMFTTSAPTTAQTSPTMASMTSHSQSQMTADPFLQYQPQFSHSLPVQLLITGIVLALTAVLLIHLCFTWQYHWPLARINWSLQFTGACTLLINIMATLYVVLTALAATSRQWPYMFEYVAIDVPRLSLWSIREIAAWYVMEAATSALVSITHIHFLTLLYPSRLEARLVFLLLGPLAILSSLMTLLPVITYSNYGSSANSTDAANSTDTIFGQNTTSDSTSPTATYVSDQKLYDIFDSARNICGLTLSFLFTLSLLIWGFLVNRESAWRTDGGTAVFGAGALLLALISTGLNFLSVFSSSTFQWLRPLLWSVVLWQSFLGWWWWAGSASGIAAREFDMERRGRREQKRSRRRKRRGDGHPIEAELSQSATSARLDRWRTSMTGTLSRRRSAPMPTAIPATNNPNDPGDRSTIHSSLSDSPSQDSTSSCHPDHTNPMLAAIHRAWRSLRQAHVRAVRVQAIEQRQIQMQMQLENGHSLGRYPGTGDAGFVVRQLPSDGEVSPSTQLREFSSSSRSLWINSFRKWRLKDSTTY